MSYEQLFQDVNEEMKERLELVMERIAEIVSEQGETVREDYRDYFVTTAKYLLLENKILEQALSGELSRMTEAQGEELNHLLYDDIQQKYDSSYANPTYAVAKLGEEYGKFLSMLYTRIHSINWRAFEGNRQFLCIYAELFVEIYNCFEAADGTSGKEISDIVYSFMHDYSEVFVEDQRARMIFPEYDYETKLVMESDLSNTAYLYRYGYCIGEDEVKISRYLNTFSDEEIQSMADTYTEGFRIGFITTGKDISIKSVLQVNYPIGFERMVRVAIQNFEKMGLAPTMYPYSISLNKQYNYDHKEDRGLWLDKALVERELEVERSVWAKFKEQAPKLAGPAVIENFGSKPFAPEQKPERVRYTDKQQELQVYATSEGSQLINKAIHGEERSFTIISYPVPSIGEQFEEIFAETVKINTLDYVLYRDMQQKIIDVLDTADRVHILGCNGNKTDLYVKIWELENPEKETAFENCVADVNIPVGEVFTSPVLKGTQGKLHVTQVYLNELNFLNLELDFEDGRIARYNCTNFASEEENRKYIEDNVLYHHKTLPMGEFAIGTNTTAYRMARVYDIADKLPILIAEKTGPHFAVGDTCYTYDEDNMTYNPDGKAIVARENEISRLRTEDMSKAYFNCHTDITIPYDELGRIEVIRKDGSTQDIIVNGRFVLPGTEPLNEPLDALE